MATDYTPESGARATRRLLSSPTPPTAIIFDSDLLAVTGLGVAQQMGFAVPDDLSLIGWDDSLISRVVHPPLTAITRDIGAYGATAAAHLLAVIEGTTREDVEVARGELTPRGSTAPPRNAVPAHVRATSPADAPGRVAVRAVRETRPCRCVKSGLTLNRISDELRRTPYRGGSTGPSRQGRSGFESDHCTSIKERSRESC